MTIEEQETMQSRAIHQLADLGAEGLMRHAQHIADDMRHDVRDGDVQHRPHHSSRPDMGRDRSPSQPIGELRTGV